MSIENDKIRNPSYFEHFLEMFAGLRIRKWNGKTWHFGEVRIEGLVISVRRNENHFEVPFG
jgi:hypothetical protein